MSNDSEQCSSPTANKSAPSTPTNTKQTPKTIQRKLESEKKKEQARIERERKLEQARLERERKVQEEKEKREREKAEKELQKKREREEKDEQRRKEKEMREQKQLEEKLEKQREKEREKELKEQQKKVEREEKEEQKKREKEEKELQKKRELEEKERKKEEERKKKEDEKRQKIEAEEKKNQKSKALMESFVVRKKVENKSEPNGNDDNVNSVQAPQIFMSFQVKEDMKIAPVTRRVLNNTERSVLEQAISSDASSADLYLSQLKSNALVPRKSSRTWQDDEDEKSSNSDDLFIIEDEEDGEGVQVLKEEPKKLYRAKFFKFHENRRPPYYGTWQKKSETIKPRKPFGLESRLDYEIDSDDEWEEEEPGESLHGSDDEKEVESEDDYEIDNEFFVPHGHLSDEELQNEDETEFNDPESLKFKLKLAQNELENERKKKCQKLKPRLIGLVWQNPDGTKPDNFSNGVWELMNKHALLFIGPSVKVEPPVTQQTENSDDENTATNKPLGPRRLQIGEKEIPDLIRLINGNQNNSKFLVKEFIAYLAKNHQPHREYSSASIKSKIKELATWQACPEEGRMFKKQCWYVPIQTRKRYNLNDLTFPNTWSYIIPPRRPVDLAESENGRQTPVIEKKSELTDVLMVSDDSNSCSVSETLTRESVEQAKSKRKSYNIAKFIRPLTQDEKKKQFEPITFNGRALEDPLSESNPNDTLATASQATKENSNPVRGKKRSLNSSTETSVPKKRIKPLMSGPIGQELSPKLKLTKVTEFLISRKRPASDANNDVTTDSSTNTAGTSDDAKKPKQQKLIGSVIVID